MFAATLNLMSSRGWLAFWREIRVLLPAASISSSCKGGNIFHAWLVHD
jgi:hypothetical protein